nr:MAG TPA: hypothetical protein [Caudoviricetes sp.]
MPRGNTPRGYFTLLDFGHKLSYYGRKKEGTK